MHYFFPLSNPPPRIPTLTKWALICLSPIWVPSLLVLGPPTYGLLKLYIRHGPINEPRPLRKLRRRRRALSMDPMPAPAKNDVRAASSPPQELDKKAECLIWTLPPEIRHEIWRYLLVPAEAPYILALEDEGDSKKIRTYCPTKWPRSGPLEYSRGIPGRGILGANRRL